MILKILSEIKLISTNTIDKEEEKILAANSIEEMLNNIDFKSEIVPINDVDKLKSLLTDLKGNQLSHDEINLIQEIAEH